MIWKKFFENIKNANIAVAFGSQKAMTQYKY